MKNRMVALLLTFFFVYDFSYATSQDPMRVDSLQQVIAAANGVDRYNAQLSLTRLYVPHDYNKALATINDAYEYSFSVKDSVRISESGRMYAQLLNIQDRWKDALAILNVIKPIAEKRASEHELALIFGNLGIVHTFLAQYDDALDMHLKALAIHQKEKDKLAQASAYNNIGNVYLRMGNYKDALKNLLLSKDLFIQEKDSENLDRVFTNIGLCYNHENQYDLAREYFDKALAFCSGKCLPTLIYAVKIGRGIADFELNDLTSAKKTFTESLEVAKSMNNPRSLSEAEFWLAKAEVKLGNTEQAKKQFLQAETNAFKADNRSLLASCYNVLADIYEKEGNLTASSRYLRKYIAIKDSIYDSDVIENYSRAKSDFEQRENVAIIKAREQTIAQQRKFNYAVMVIAVMFLGFMLFLFRNNRIMKQMNVRLTEAQNLIFEQNKKLEVRNRELDQLVEKKTEELRMVNLSLKQMNDELDTFINKTADDIRAPLASLKGICNVALKDIQDQAPLMYLHRINSTTESLNSILKRLLALNKINQSKITYAEIDLRTLVDGVLSVLQKKGLPGNLIIRKNIESNSVINTDKELLSVVLENSIDNAIKFCNNSPRAEHFIEINVKHTRNGRVSFSIIDNGVGVNHFTLEEFDEFFLNSQTEGNQPERKDLYFVKTAAKKIGGKVEMHRTLEGYNELSVIL